MRGGPRSLVEEVEFFCLLGETKRKRKGKKRKNEKNLGDRSRPFSFFQPLSPSRLAPFISLQTPAQRPAIETRRKYVSHKREKREGEESGSGEELAMAFDGIAQKEKRKEKTLDQGRRLPLCPHFPRVCPSHGRKCNKKGQKK